MLCYFTPVFGAILADTYLGKFKYSDWSDWFPYPSLNLNWDLNLQDHSLSLYSVRFWERSVECRIHTKRFTAKVSRWSILSWYLTNGNLNTDTRKREFSLLGLFIIAVGTGGIKPCVSAFGGEQFIRPQQDRQLEQFFSVFYFAINAGSLISTFITPIFREDVKCFGNDSCYPLAFGVPAILMIVAVGKSPLKLLLDF